MADDINELLDEVESKYNDSEDGSHLPSVKKSGSPEIYTQGTEEINAAVHSICGVPGPIRTVISQNVRGSHYMPPNGSGGVMFIHDASSQVGLHSGTPYRRNSSRRKQRQNSTVNNYNKRFFAKPVFELSVENLEAEKARRRQKEVIEKLFEDELAVVVPKIILDERKYKRIKSDVWDFFGDVRIFIDEARSKELNIDCNVIHINGEEFLLCKSFVACRACSAVFSYESHSYGTSTLRSHLKSCGKPRFNRKDKTSSRPRDRKQLLDEKPPHSCKDGSYVPRTELEEQKINLRGKRIELQKQIVMFFLSGTKSFETVKNTEFQKLMQMCISIGDSCKKTGIQNILCSQNELAGNLIQKFYNDSVVGFTSDMGNVYGVSFSFEIWNDTSKNTSYLNMLCYYSDDNGTFKSVILHTLEFAYEKKSGGDLCNAFLVCLNDTGLYPFRRSLVIDYSLNMRDAFEGEQFIFCICQCIDFMVQNMLYNLITFDDDNYVNFPSFVELINQCGTVVMYFKHNKKQHDLPKYLHLCSPDCDWKSVLMMLKSLSDQWDHIVDVLDEHEELELLDIDEELMNVVIDFLQIFYDGIVELASVTHPTVNLVIPWWGTWKSHCMQQEGELQCLTVLKSFMNAQMEEMAVSISLLHKIATMFDPRFKQLEFLTKEDRVLVQTEAEKLVKECEKSFLEKNLYAALNQDVSGTGNISDLHSDTQSQVNLGVCLNSSNEIGNYLAESFSMCGDDVDTEGRFNPLKYWARVKSHYPHLSKVASWILSCPASSLRNNERSFENKWMVSVRDIEYPHDKISYCLFSKSYKNL